MLQVGFKESPQNDIIIVLLRGSRLVESYCDPKAGSGMIFYNYICIALHSCTMDQFVVACASKHMPI